LDVAGGEGPAGGDALTTEDEQHPDAIKIAVIPPLADPRDVGQPAGVEGARPMGDGEGETIHHRMVLGRHERLCHRVWEHEERPPQATQAAVEGAVAQQERAQMPQVFPDRAAHAALALPRDPAPPWRGQPHAEDCAIAHVGGGATMDLHLGVDILLVEIVDNDVQCHKEGFEIEIQGHISFGERL
jgi:hypothetical protein